MFPFCLVFQGPLPTIVRLGIKAADNLCGVRSLTITRKEAISTASLVSSNVKNLGIKSNQREMTRLNNIKLTFNVVWS